MLRWVDQARLYPARCSVLPQVGAAHQLGYIDTGQDTPSGERVYISIAAVNLIADACGFQRPGDVHPREAELKRLRARVSELEAELARKSEALDAVYVLKRDGFGTSRKPGRPPKAVA